MSIMKPRIPPFLAQWAKIKRIFYVQTIKFEGRRKTISNKQDFKKTTSHLLLSQEAAGGGALSQWGKKTRGRCETPESGTPVSVTKDSGNFRQHSRCGRLK